MSFLGKLPWWSAFPLSAGFGLISVFAPDAVAPWLRFTLFWVGVGLAVVGIIAAGAHFRWGRPSHSRENAEAYGRFSGMAFQAIGKAMAVDNPLEYEMTVATIEPLFLLLKNDGILIPRLRGDGCKLGVLRAHRYLNLVHGPLQIGDNREAKRRAKKAVPLINAVPEQRLWRDVKRLHPHPLSDAPIRDRTGVLNAALYMVFHEWDRSCEDLSAEDQIRLIHGNLSAMVQDAIDGNLTIWIRRQRHGGPHINPGSEYWEEHHLDWVREHGALSAWPNSGGGLTQGFEPLVRKSDIEKLYG